MAYTVEKLLEIARNEIGYKEKETNNQLDNKTANAGDGNYTKYGRDLYAAGYYNGNKNGYAWCDQWVDWIFYQLCDRDAAKAQEIICQSGPLGAGCKYSAQYYKQAGRYYTSNPKPGDQIFFGNFEHTGIVEAVSGNIITTIEGNTSNQVARRTYSINSDYVIGFGRPRYDIGSSVSGKASTGSEADEKKIWDYLMKKIDNPYGVAALMGNMYAESVLKSDNLEQLYERKLGHTDKSYVQAVDNGSYTNFVRDAAGFGLCQWTYYTRKQALLNYAKAKNKSIADLDMQLEFLYKELSESYPVVLNTLKNAKTISLLYK